MRPKKPRYINGVQLAPNLYADPRGRENYYSYKYPNNRRISIYADTVEEANLQAEIESTRKTTKAAPKRYVPVVDRFVKQLPVYFSLREEFSPSLRNKRSWHDRKGAMLNFADGFPVLSKLTHKDIYRWWCKLGYNQQKARHAEFRRLFNWLMVEELVPLLEFNPFTNSDDHPRLLLKEKPTKKRLALTIENYKKIYVAARTLDYLCLQVAMEISRYTTLRIGDICSLTWKENVIDGELRVIVSKSVAQKGTARASRLSWKLDSHPILNKVIQRARELSLVNKRCPFLISHEPKRKVWNQNKLHYYQIDSHRLSRLFRESAKKAGVTGTSFHEIRGLASTLYRKQGYSNEEIREVMAHESVATTLAYQDPNQLPFEAILLALNE